MDEQLEQQIEGRGAEAQIEEVLSQAGEETTEETVPEAGNPEAEVNTESSAEEKEISDAELSASEDPNKPSLGGEGGSERSPASSETMRLPLKSLFPATITPSGRSWLRLIRKWSAKSCLRIFIRHACRANCRLCGFMNP